jgi:hypothetical protein
MNRSKVFASLFLFLSALCISVVNGADLEYKIFTANITEEIKTELKKLNLDFYDLDEPTVNVKFMVNNDNQIIVLSTSQESLDSAIKSILNYKKVKDNDLRKFHVYVLPVKFEAT